jgi:hypothetical protein
MCHKIEWHEDGQVDVDYYPSPVTRKRPEWQMHLLFGVHGMGKE